MFNCVYFYQNLKFKKKSYFTQMENLQLGI